MNKQDLIKDLKEKQSKAKPKVKKAIQDKIKTLESGKTIQK